MAEEAAKKPASGGKPSEGTRQELIKSLLAHILALAGEGNGEGTKGAENAPKQEPANQNEAGSTAGKSNAPQMPQTVNVVHHIMPTQR
jgi:hypothetical protein